MIITEEQIGEQAAEDFEKEFHVKVKLFAKGQRKETDSTVQIRRGGNIYGACLRPEGWLVYDSREEPAGCCYVTKPSDLNPTAAGYYIPRRPWKCADFIKKGDKKRV